MKKYLVFLFIGLLFMACKKKQTIHISAKNAVTGEGYADLNYTIIRVKTGMFESNYKEVASGNLNENGEAFITKRLTKNASYNVNIQDPGNTCYNNQPSFTFADGDKFDANFEFAECGYLQQNIKNVNCEGSNDTFYIRDKYTYTAWTGWIEITGCFSNVGGGYSEVPAGTRYFQWKVTRSSGTTTGVDTVVFLPGEYIVPGRKLNIFKSLIRKFQRQGL